MILVTGATGTVGSEVLRLLVRRGVAVRASTRDPVRLRSFEADVEVVKADFETPRTLRAAATGVEAVFLLTAPGASVAEHDLAMINAARAAGVRKVVKVSAIGGREAADTAPAGWHAPGERALAESSLAWTVLRPSSFASNALQWAGAIRAGTPVPNMTGTGAQGVVDPRDIAEVAVETLLSTENDGAVLTLTGPELINVPSQVAALAEALEQPLSTVDVPLEAAKEQMLAAGVDPSVVEVAVRGYQLVSEGGNAVVTDHVEHVLGRPARAFRTWAREHRAAFLDTGITPRGA
ncbi:NAD(P)H-binding protein [Allokutzneria oryzae]|uniref:NAD(P)H-binding protein n=1 Tax=Allokutzneria oryzae TaxID=1378989 RepID=A0ABV5ZX96_9PSEU